MNRPAVPTYAPSFRPLVQQLRGAAPRPEPELLPATGTAGPPPRRSPRIDYLIDRIPEGSSVLDLGCSGGDMLYHLQSERRAEVCGLEQREEAVRLCRARRVRAHQTDVDNLADPALTYALSRRWDVVLAIDTIFYWRFPAVIFAALADRVGRIYITVGNSAHIKLRWDALLGRCDTWPNCKRAAAVTEYDADFTVTGRWTLAGFSEWAGGLGYDCRLAARRSIQARYVRPSPFPGLLDRAFLFELTPRPPLPV